MSVLIIKNYQCMTLHWHGPLPLLTRRRVLQCWGEWDDEGWKGFRSQARVIGLLGNSLSPLNLSQSKNHSILFILFHFLKGPCHRARCMLAESGVDTDGELVIKGHAKWWVARKSIGDNQKKTRLQRLYISFFYTYVNNVTAKFLFDH